MDRRALLGLKASPRKAGGGEAAAQANYLRLPTITANVIRSGGRRGVMTVETGVDTSDAALRVLVAQLQAATNTVMGRAGARLLIGTVMVV